MALFKAHYLKALFILLLGYTFTLDSLAQSWTGNVNSDWNNSANWSSWPLNGADILIDPANYTGAQASPVISVNSVFTPAGVIVQNGAQLTIYGNLTANDRVEVFGPGTVVAIYSGTVYAAGSGSKGRFIVSDGAEVIQHGGTLRTNERAVVELGGSFVMNNGTLSPGELAIGDGNTLHSSTFTMTGGLVSVSELVFENESGTYDPTFAMSGGVFTSSGNMSWLGVAPGSGTPRFIMTGGTATVNRDIINDPASTVSVYIDLSGTSSFVFNGANLSLALATDSIVQSGSAVFTLGGTTTFTNPGVFRCSQGNTVFAGYITLQGTGSYQFDNLQIPGGGRLSHMNPASIQVAGNFMNEGLFTAGSNTVIFNGNTPQAITGKATNFNRLMLENTSAEGVTLNASIVIDEELVLNQGKLNSNANNLVSLIDNATASGGSALSFVNGPLRKVGDDAFVFPIGKNNKWRRLAITAPLSAGTGYTAEYMDNSHSSIAPVIAPLNAVTNIEHWTLGRVNSTSPVQVTLYWEDAAASAIHDCSQLSMAFWNGLAWDNVTSAPAGTCTGNGNGSIQSNAALTDMGAFTFGFLGNVTTRNLNICNGDSVEVGSRIYKSTGTYIDVLSAADLSDSTVITRLKVMVADTINQSVSLCYGDSLKVGTSTYTVSGNYTDTLVSVLGCDSLYLHTALTIHDTINVTVSQAGAMLTADDSTAGNYQWIDCNNQVIVGSGRSYTATASGNYAVIISEGGCTDTSACYSVTIASVAKTAALLFSVYPNPSQGNMMVQLKHMAPATLRLRDITGRVVMEKHLATQLIPVDYSIQPAGVYLLEVVQEGVTGRVKLVKE